MAGVALLFYGATVSHHLLLPDAAILLDAMRQPEISSNVCAHNLTHLLGWLFQQLPLANIALKGNLASVCCGAAASAAGAACCGATGAWLGSVSRAGGSGLNGGTYAGGAGGLAASAKASSICVCGTPALRRPSAMASSENLPLFAFM